MLRVEADLEDATLANDGTDRKFGFAQSRSWRSNRFTVGRQETDLLLSETLGGRMADPAGFC